MKMCRALKFVVFTFVVFAAMGGMGQSSSRGKRKWLVLDPITYGRGVKSSSFLGIDGLLLTKLADARKYSVIDKDASKTALAENALNGADGVRHGAGYSVRGEVVDAKATGATLRKGQQIYKEYVVSVNLRVNRLEPPQETHIGKTVRIQEFVISEKDMLIYVVDQLAREILFKEFPIRVWKIQEDGKTFTLNYGEGFLAVGATYEICELSKEEDPDTGIIEDVLTPKGVCQITEVYERRATAVLTGGTVKKGNVLRQSKAQSKAEQAVGIVASNTGDLSLPKVQQQVAAQSGRYSCVVGNFGFAAGFQAYRYIPDADVVSKAIGGALGIFGSRNKNRATAGAIGNLLSDNSHNQPFRVQISWNEWRGIAERAFAACPDKFDMHAGVNPRCALQDGIRYAVNGNVSQLYEKDGQCTVSFVLSMTDLEQNGSIVFSKDLTVTVPGVYAGQATFAQAIANGVALFANQLQ